MILIEFDLNIKGHNLDQLKWINLLSCNENMIKNIIE